MLLFLTMVLVFSSLGMVMLLYAKHWELATGRVLFSAARPKIASGAHRVLVFFEYRLPSFVRQLSHTGYRSLRFHARDSLARVLIAIETWLEQALNTLRHGLSPSRHAKLDTSDTSEVSAFLREVVEHKRKLMHLTRPHTAAGMGARSQIDVSVRKVARRAKAKAPQDQPLPDTRHISDSNHSPDINTNK